MAELEQREEPLESEMADESAAEAPASERVAEPSGSSTASDTPADEDSQAQDSAFKRFLARKDIEVSFQRYGAGSR